MLLFIFVQNIKQYIMKKLLYLFLTLLIVACSSDDNNNDGDNNNNTSSLAGIWNLTSQTNAAGPVDLEATCANENYLVLNDTSGTIYFHFNEDSEGNVVPCYVSRTGTCTYTNTPAGSNQYLLTTGDGFVLSGELNSNGTVLSIINEDDDVLNFTKQ